MSFKENSYQQISFSDSFSGLTAREQKALENSWAKVFADEIFPAIDEKRFSVFWFTWKTWEAIPCPCSWPAATRRTCPCNLSAACCPCCRWRCAFSIAAAMCWTVGFPRRRRHETSHSESELCATAGIGVMHGCLLPHWANHDGKSNGIPASGRHCPRRPLRGQMCIRDRL